MVWGIWSAWQTHWMNPWALVLVILGIWFSFTIRWKSRLMPWCLSYILLTSVGYSYQYRNFPLSPSTLSSLLAVLCFLIFCALPEPRMGYVRLMKWAGLLGVCAAFLAPFCLLGRDDSRWLMPVLWNRSMGGVFTVLALAPTPLYWVGGAASLVLMRSTPVFTFLAFWVSRRRTWMRLPLVLLAGLAWVSWKGLPSDTGRFDFWALYWNNFVHQDTGTILFGTRLGTTAALLPLAQAANGMHAGDQYYPWLHNDYFQALTELGVIGFVICILTGISIWRRANREQRALGVALCVAMLTDFPWHWMPEALVYWIWIRTNVVDQETVSVNSSTPSCIDMNSPNAKRLLVTIS